MHYTYILRSLKDNRFYVGSTDYVDRRFHEHNSGEVPSTRLYCPWELYYYEEYQTRSEAFKREMQIKAWKKRSMIEKLNLNKIEDSRFYNSDKVGNKIGATPPLPPTGVNVQ